MLDSSSMEIEMRRKREEFSIEVRQLQRQDILKKKRNIYMLPSSSLTFDTDVFKNIHVKDIQDQIDFYSAKDFNLHDLPKLIEFAHSSEILQQHYACIGIRKLLSLERGSPIQQIIDAGIVPILVSNLYLSNYPFLQRDSAWALTNIAAGSTSQTELILMEGALPPLMDLLYSNVEELYEQAIWAIGNIAGDNTTFRDQVLEIGIGGLVGVATNTKNPNVFKNSTWALSNLSRGKPSPEYAKVKDASKVFKAAVQKCQEDDELLADSLWALSCLSDGKDDQIQDIVDLGILANILSFLRSEKLGLLIPSLRIVGNIISGNEKQTQAILKLDPFDIFIYLLGHPKKTVRRETCWIISNVVATNNEAADAVIRNEELLQMLFHMSENDCSEIKKEILYVFSNICNNGIKEQIEILVENHLIQIYLEFMTEFKEPRNLLNILEGLFFLLKRGENFNQNSFNPFLKIFEDNNGPKKLEELQEHHSKCVVKKATEILEHFFEYQLEV